MATITTTYLSQLRIESKHVKSGNQVLTDAPTDNHGKGETFSPTDLLATALGTCMLTLMGIHGRKEGLVLDGATAETIKVMGTNPRRVSELEIELRIPGKSWTQEQREFLEEKGLACPVAMSLHPDLTQKVRFSYF